MRLPITQSVLRRSFNASTSISRFNTFKQSPLSQVRNMSSMSDLNIENTNIKTASGVSLDDHQKTLVGSILDVSTSLPESRSTIAANLHTSSSPAAPPSKSYNSGPTTAHSKTPSPKPLAAANMSPNGTVCKPPSQKSSVSTMKSPQAAIPSRWTYAPATSSKVSARNRQSIVRSTSSTTRHRERSRRLRISGMGSCRIARFRM